MDIQAVADIIHRIADGFEESCAECLDANKGTVLQAIREQLYSGQDGEDAYLSPTYDNDPFFNEEGYWHNRAKDYKAWKRELTPPVSGTMLGILPRPDEVPNLFIDGTFYSEIRAQRQGMALVVDPGSGHGPEILAKYGDNILTMGTDAREFFNLHYMLPSIEKFFRDCGYK